MVTAAAARAHAWRGRALEPPGRRNSIGLIDLATEKRTIQPVRAVRAYPVAEIRLRMGPNIRFYLLPIAFVVAYLLA